MTDSSAVVQELRLLLRLNEHPVHSNSAIATDDVGEGVGDAVLAERLECRHLVPGCLADMVAKVRDEFGVDCAGFDHADTGSSGNELLA